MSDEILDEALKAGGPSLVEIIKLRRRVSVLESREIDGISPRLYLIGQILPALLTNPPWRHQQYGAVVKQAVQIADLALAEYDKPQPERNPDAG
jgi:hypothetical protein